MKKISFFLFICSLAAAQSFSPLQRVRLASTGDSLFLRPAAIDISPEKKVYVVDTGHNRIVVLDSGGRVTQTIGGFGFEAEQFDEPRDIWSRSVVDIYVSDYNNRRLQRFDRQLNFLSFLEANSGLSEELQFDYAASCAVSSQNELFLLSQNQDKVIKYNRNGDAEYAFGYLESASAELNEPQQIDIWRGDRLLVSNSGDSSVIVFDFFGNLLRRIVSPFFIRPTGLTVIDDNYFLLADPAAGALFLVDHHYAVKKVASGLKHPRDAALLREGETLFLFVIDGNEMIKGILTLP
ncbi:MAG TPA: hypothetical protein ENJ15_02320 [Caldithrix abyssi]|uniref:6-bladed beta-propeller n=1 Tax=Caldithrix abyssi TaxID=187145 RepID=A0A7V5VED2_CALAY|nr:hypothetical protein [Caldithrix abyssi]